MIKILFLIESLSGGGAELALVRLVNRLDPAKFAITVQTVKPCDRGALKSHIRYRCINRRGSYWFSRWLRLCAETKWAYPLYIRDGYDMEVAYLESFPTKLLAQASDAVKLAWVHCDMAHKSGREKMRPWYGCYDRVVCVSQDMEKSFLKYFNGNTVVLPNVMDDSEILEKSREFTAEKFDILAVGRLSREKGFDRLLDACSCLDARVGILGDGPERPALEARAKELGLDVTFLGYRENPYPYMAGAKLLAIPSRSEGLSTVAVEGLILGKAMVAAPCTGMETLLGGCALLTEDLALGLSRLLGEAELRRELEEKAASRGRVLAKQDAAARTEAFFLSALREKRGL